VSREDIHKCPFDDVLFEKLVNTLEGDFGSLRNTDHGIQKAASDAAAEEEEGTVGNVSKHDGTVRAMTKLNNHCVMSDRAMLSERTWLAEHSAASTKGIGLQLML
jgi:hypothetical protein